MVGYQCTGKNRLYMYLGIEYKNKIKQIEQRIQQSPKGPGLFPKRAQFHRPTSAENTA